MTELEIEFLKRLLALLEAQRSRLEEMIKSTEEVLDFERSTHTSLECLDRSKE